MRSRYDNKEDLKAPNYNHPNFDVFNHFMNMHMGGGGGRQKSNQPIKREDYVHKIKVSLQEIYTGCQKILKVSLSKYCFKCNKKCNECNGTGIVVVIRNMGILQMQQQAYCNACNGTGEKLEVSGCNECKNGKITENKT